VVAQVTGGGAVHTSAGCKPFPGSLMPSFEHTLSTTQIASVAKYVSSVAGTVKGSSSTSSGGGGLP
jgi:mono/diheme cytochrome c family protein